MANQYRPTGARWARNWHTVAKIATAAVLSVLGYATMVGSAHGPGYGQLADFKLPAKVEVATLSMADGKPTITGSIASMFDTGSFAGPNRALKQDRARITVDVASFSTGFESSRQHLATLWQPAKPAGDTIRLASKQSDTQPTVALAALTPADGSAALNAIDSIVPDASIPMPATPSTQLAYAREDAPVTTFPDPSAQKYGERDLWCLAEAIYFEARGESYRGQVAVAQVVMNRLKHPLYPKTICGVVFQGESKRNACQFSFACDGRPETVTDKKSWAQAEEIAGKVTSGELYLAEVANATHYHAAYVYPDWAPRLTRVTKIGLHIFYRFKHG
ncbi:MAG TPA: cell wall hydrolase [Devosiaceae bacterium]|jgi:spore germination cell wall hydrolase CwlJ-like protein